MDYKSGFPFTKNGNNFVYVVVDRFSKMVIFAPCNKSITAKATTKLFFEHIWVHFGLPWTIILDRDSRILSTFRFILWPLIDSKITKSTAFHPQIDGKIKVVNQMTVHIIHM
jgi:hypothetical protein